MIFIGVILSLFTSTPLAMAETKFKFSPRAAAGYTTNANLEDTDEDGDLLLQVRGLATLRQSSQLWSLRASYQDYASESQNDSFNWRMEHVMPTPWQLKESIDWLFAVGGQHFTNGSPANSEENFDWLTAETALNTSQDLDRKLSWFTEFGYSFRRYTHFDNRSDHQIYLLNQFDWQMNLRHLLMPAIEIGLVRSNDSIYSRRVLSLSADWHFLMNSSWTLKSRILIKTTTFPNRTVSRATAVSTGRGKFRNTNQNENERQNLLQTEVAGVKSWKQSEGGVSLTVSQQSSRSGFEDYSELLLMAFASHYF